VTLVDEYKIMRRVAGRHNYRLDGLTDLLVRALGMSVLDLGCNRGAAGYDFAQHGARVVHGCDINKDAILIAKHWFADCRNVEAKHEVIDLSKGADAIRQFCGPTHYDTILMLATYHKIKRVMPAPALSGLMQELAKRTIKYLAWRATSEKYDENNAEMSQIDKDVKDAGLKRVHTSHISQELGVAAIWARV
jgi:SAM-dependent methyltransferase